MFKCFVLSIIIFFLNACGEILSPVIPPIIPSDDEIIENQYELNLNALNSGHNLNSVDIIWNKYDDDDFSNYELKYNNNTEIISSNLDTTFTINGLSSGVFQSIYLTINLSNSETTDNIDIFTRSILPITNFNARAESPNWYSSLVWESSEESSFKKYEIYRLNQLNYENNKFTDLNACKLLSTIIDINTTSYIDSINIITEMEYYYMIITYNQNDYLRYSIIKSNINNPVNNVLAENIKVSNSEYNKIIINWEHALDENFYQLEIWRSESESINPINGNKLVTITDKNMNKFIDSYIIGNGLSWFYKIKLIDIYGNYFTSETIVGNSHP